MRTDPLTIAMSGVNALDRQKENDDVRVDRLHDEAEAEFTYKAFTTRESLVTTLKAMPEDDMNVLLECLVRPTTSSNEFYGYMVRRQHMEDYKNAKTPDTYIDEPEPMSDIEEMESRDK